jgi:hypothetical protein
MKYPTMLSPRFAERRRYTSEYDYGREVELIYDRCRFKYGDAVEGEPPKRIGGYIDVSDFHVRGVGGHSTLGINFGVELPTDFLEFNDLFKNYALVCRNGINILDSDDVADITQGLRDGEDISSESPYRIYRFAQIFGEPAHFMLRWNEDKTFRDVAFARYTDSTEEDILGNDSAIFSCDRSFSAWLERMIKTDAAPLHPTLSDEYDYMVHRL